MTFDEASTSEIIACVREVAAAEIMTRFRRLDADDIETKAGPTDIVTLADLRAEAALTKVFQSLSPDTLIVGEEAVAADPGLLEELKAASSAIIIDPIDGTSNFAAGLPLFGVIIAGVEQGITTFGLLFDPVMDDWVMARRGEGAWLCGPDQSPQRLSCRPTPPKGAVHAYVPFNHFPAEGRAEAMNRYAPLGFARDLRCSCHEYRTMAFGQADLIVSLNPSPWDHAAGVLVVEEAGGASRLQCGTGYSVMADRSLLRVTGDRAGGLLELAQKL